MADQRRRETRPPDGTQFISAFGGSPNKLYSDFVQNASHDVLTLGLRGTSLVLCKFSRDSESWQIVHEFPGEYRVGRHSFCCSVHRALPTQRPRAGVNQGQMALGVFCFTAHRALCCGDPIHPIFRSDDEGRTWTKHEDPLSQVELSPSRRGNMSDFSAATHQAIRKFGNSNHPTLAMGTTKGVVFRDMFPGVRLSASVVSPDGTIIAICSQTPPKKYDERGFEISGGNFWLISSEDGGQTWNPLGQEPLTLYKTENMGSLHTSPTRMNLAMFLALDGPQGLIVFFCPYPLRYDAPWYVWRETTKEWRVFSRTTTPGLPDFQPFHVFSPQAWTSPGGRF